MPSIEIACISLQETDTPPSTSFAVVCERGLVSHRSPNPRFQTDFDDLSGCLYHLGNPGLTDATEGIFIAHELLSEACRASEPSLFLEFDRNHLTSMRILLEWLLERSPLGHLLFTTDWQFGPTGSVRASAMTLAQFWSLHDSRELRLNAAYPISRAV